MAVESDHDDLFDDEPETSERTSTGGRGLLSRQTILIGLVAAALICLVVVLIVRVFLDTGEEVVGGDTPTPEQTPTEETTVIVTVEEEQPTPTATRVLAEGAETEEEGPVEPSSEGTAEPTSAPTATPVSTGPPTATAPPSDGAADLSVSVGGAAPGKTAQLLENDSFEADFDEQGVAVDWNSFKSKAAVVSFSREITGPYVKTGSNAQRISIAGATQPNQYAGIYQRVKVVPNQPYTLTLHGQVRTGFGDVNQSSYGYRMQYAVDQTGGQDWREIPTEDWVELPWDEQKLGSTEVKFLEYTTQITPTARELTLFVRAWNKWADPGLVEYTLDDLSLVGPASMAAPIAEAETEEELIDQPLPTTGAGDTLSLIDDGRFWGAMLILLVLGAGAIYRGRWGY